MKMSFINNLCSYICNFPQKGIDTVGWANVAQTQAHDDYDNAIGLSIFILHQVANITILTCLFGPQKSKKAYSFTPSFLEESKYPRQELAANSMQRNFEAHVDRPTCTKKSLKKS